MAGRNAGQSANPIVVVVTVVSVLVTLAAAGVLLARDLFAAPAAVVIAAPQDSMVGEASSEMAASATPDVPAVIPPSITPTPLPPTATDTPTIPSPTDTAIIISLPTSTPIPSDTPTPTLTPTPADPDDPLTGLPTDPANLALRPYIVMIDNHPDASPQSGMDKAAIVFEALAEGGITRFMAVFDGSSPIANEIGPVRSARVYYVDWATPFHALYVHAGGSPAALDLLWQVPLINADLLSTGPSWRSDDRFMPHNLYTSAPSLRQWMSNNGTLANSDFVANRLLHKLDAPQPSQHPNLSFDFGSVSHSDVLWSYDVASNAYLRSMWGYPHLDRISGQQLSAKNVVIIFTTRNDILNDDKGRLELGTVGRGDALFAIDGVTHTGSWQKVATAAPLHFLNADGTEVQFNRGNTWIEVLPIGQPVNY